MATPIFHVDAFTERPFAGNPAAVCILAGLRDDGWLQAVAAEMNLSETAFLLQEAECWSLRWFTPAIEVDLCGHATLASAHILWDNGFADAGRPLAFQTRSGLLQALRRDEMIELDFPALAPEASPAAKELLSALGTETPRWSGRNRFDLFLHLEGEAAVRALSPDFPRLARACGAGRGVIVTAASDRPEYDFVSRFFAPAVGIDEDPVTGSAHCSLGPYWGDRLARTHLRGYQASARGGTVSVRVAGARVHLGGRAITVARGELV